MLVQKYGGISTDFSKNEMFQALKVLDRMIQDRVLWSLFFFQTLEELDLLSW